MLYLNAAEVRALLRWEDLIEAMAGALQAFSEGRARQPLRMVTELPGGGCLFAMPAFLPNPPSLGTKLVTICPGNAALGKETHQATLVMLNAGTGEMAAVLEAAHLTAMRTAAVSALSLRALGRSDSQRLCVLGSGAQARAHVEGFRKQRDWHWIRAWSPSATRLTRFAEECGIEKAPSAEAAARDADVIVLATSSAEPVLQAGWVAPGAHVISVGAPRPSEREMDPELLRKARVFVDSRASALAESGDIRESGAPVVAELGEVLAGTAKGRLRDDEITVFKSLGLAVEDVAAGAIVLATLGR
ncbi:MAG: ornithine cyclodeaminase family protein [Bryobacteraceae bacterium]